ncbi:hypothetical protein [Synechococcus elongatus]|uniref:hypothetical protein n=1 Tax=Synechococcus elongatus TaxID=32046 RepID=UPI000F7E50A0|nr:hypothetical protein [Synechococcus elongatus]
MFIAKEPEPSARLAADARTIALLLESSTQLLLQIQLADAVTDPLNPHLTMKQSMGPFYRQAVQEILTTIRTTAATMQSYTARDRLEVMMGQENHES